MYRVIKALNHNAVLALEAGTSREYLILGKGIGFGKRSANGLNRAWRAPSIP